MHRIHNTYMLYTHIDTIYVGLDLTHPRQAPASSVFLLRVEFESSSSKKSEYRVE